MGQNSAMWGREAKFVYGDEENGEFCEFFENFVSFLVDRSTIFIEMRSAEVGDMIYTPPAKVTGTLSYPSFSGNSQRMCVLGRSNHVCLSQIATRYANLAAGILI